MSRATQTIGAGFKALGGASMSAYTLEFLTQSGSRRPGTTETIVVPHAEMGRDRTCAIRFDSSEKTVSRKHASISSEGGQYFITPLSQTNQTFVNGAAINGRVPLTNGSEIQLSSSG
ncbi:MAG: FHA domain-containing protein, partial [Marinilabiliales bacterium]